MKETHAGDRVPELDDLGVSGLVDPHVVEEVRQVPLEPAGTLCHERGLGVSGPPGVFLGAWGERRRGGRPRGRGGRGGGAGDDGAARGAAPTREALGERRERRGRSSTDGDRGALRRRPSWHLRPEPPRSSESARPLGGQGSRRRPLTSRGHRRCWSTGLCRCGGHGGHCSLGALSC